MKSVDKNTFEVTLCIRNKLVKLRVIIPRGPSKVIHILGDDGGDFTEELQPYLSYETPTLKLKDVTETKTLQILLSNGENINLGEDDVLSLKQG